MIKNNKPDRISLDALKLASKSLEVWDGMSKRGMGKYIAELGNHIEDDNVIRKSGDPITRQAKNIVRKMISATDRIMRRGK